MADLEDTFDSVWRLGALYIYIYCTQNRNIRKFDFDICKLHEKPPTKKPGKQHSCRWELVFCKGPY